VRVDCEEMERGKEKKREQGRGVWSLSFLSALFSFSTKNKHPFLSFSRVSFFGLTIGTIVFKVYTRSTRITHPLGVVQVPGQLAPNTLARLGL